MHSDPSLDHVYDASPEELVLLLFEGAVRFGTEARAAIAAGDRPEGRRLLDRVRAIVSELESCLNHEAGTISQHLAAIYEYVQRRLEPADVAAGVVEEVVNDLQALCESWAALVDRRAPEPAAA